VRRTNRGPEASEKASPNRSDELTPTSPHAGPRPVLMKCACPITTLTSSGLSTAPLPGTASSSSHAHAVTCTRQPRPMLGMRTVLLAGAAFALRFRVRPRTHRKCAQPRSSPPEHRQLSQRTKSSAEITAGSSGAHPRRSELHVLPVPRRVGRGGCEVLCRRPARSPCRPRCAGTLLRRSDQLTFSWGA
jgi:hypothetical protein